MIKKIILVLLFLIICMTVFASAREEQFAAPSLYIGSDRNPLILGIFYGIFIFIICYYLMLYFPSKDKSYLLFAVWIFSLTGLMMVLEGTVFRYFLNEQFPIVSNILNYLFQGGSFIGGLFFFRELLSVKKETPLLDKILLTNIGIAVFYLCTYFFGVLLLDVIPDMKILDIMGLSLGIIHSLTFTCIALVYYKRKLRIIKLYIPGLIALVTGVWIHNFSQGSPLYKIFFVKYAIHIGILIMIFCFNFALSIRISKIRREQEEQRQKLIQADKMVSLGTMASSLAHEIANPNSAVISNAHFLEQNFTSLKPLLEQKLTEEETDEAGLLPPDILLEKFSQAISGILNSSDRIRDMIRQLREYYKQSNPRRKDRIDINEVINNALDLTRSELKKSSIQVSRNFSASVPEIMGNFQQLEQVFINLIINSRQAIAEKRESGRSLSAGNNYIMINTKLDEKENNISITVKDSGRGMDQEAIKNIRKAFFSTRLDSGGSGLGLYISDKIISDHQGCLKFSSEKDKWTEAVITLPLSGKE